MRGLYFSGKQKSNTHTEVYKDLTSAYLKYLRGIVKTQRVDSCIPNAVRLISTDTDACMELYRHALCTCLNLDSVLAYKALEPLVKSCEMCLSDVVEKVGLKNAPLALRKGVLEACMHCIVMTRNQARGF